MSRGAAFDLVCGVLSLDDAPGHRQALHCLVTSGTIRWRDMIAIASEDWVSPAVFPALVRKNLTVALTPDVVDYFSAATILNRQRNAALRSQAIELARTLNGVGIAPVFLKGGANLLSGLYPDQATRMMIDLDVLVPNERLATCVGALKARGYRELWDNDFPACHHYPPLGCQGCEGAVELHVAPLHLGCRQLLSAADVIDGASSLKIEGAKFMVPAPSTRLVHCIAHAQFTNHARLYGDLSLRELLDTALLCRSADIDWQWVTGRFTSRAEARALTLHLLACERLLGGRVRFLSSPTRTVHALFRYARMQSRHPALKRWTRNLLRPWLLLNLALSHPLLRRRLLRCLVDANWYARQWRMLCER